MKEDPAAAVMRRLLELAVAEKLCAEASVRFIEGNVASGKFTVAYYIEMWSERLGKERKDVQDILKQVNEVRPHPEFQKNTFECGRVNRNCIL